MIVDSRPIPIVLAPLGGGPSTPELTAAVSNAGGLGFLAAAYLTTQALAERIAATRGLTAEPFGVNVFVPGQPAAPDEVARYGETLADEARRAGIHLGVPRFHDDEWAAKLDLLIRDPVPVVSFAFGCPPTQAVQSLRRVGSQIWVTVTSPAEAAQAAAAGADALVVQGGEAGGHRGGFADTDATVGLLPLLQLVAAGTDLPLVATGGIATGAAVAAVLAAGARAAALGTAFLRCPEAGTAAVHRAALDMAGPTALTRSFTGRAARGIRNRFMVEHTDAPSAYPEVHYLTAPLRQAGRAANDPDLVNLWAGEAYPLTRALPAAQLVRELYRDAQRAAAQASGRLDRPVAAARSTP
jgi:nitronate monooxygenase